MRLDLIHILIIIILLFGLYLLFSKCGCNNGFSIGGNIKKYRKKNNINCTPLVPNDEDTLAHRRGAFGVATTPLNSKQAKIYNEGLLWADTNDIEVRKKIIDIYMPQVGALKLEDDIIDEMWSAGPSGVGYYSRILYLRDRIGVYIYDWEHPRGLLGGNALDCTNATISTLDDATNTFTEQEVNEENCNRCVVFSKRRSTGGIRDASINENKCAWDSSKQSCINRKTKQRGEQDTEYRLRHLSEINSPSSDPSPDPLPGQLLAASKSLHTRLGDESVLGFIDDETNILERIAGYVTEYSDEHAQDVKKRVELEI